jgi:hypothetical protein
MQTDFIFALIILKIAKITQISYFCKFFFQITIFFKKNLPEFK